MNWMNNLPMHVNKDEMASLYDDGNDLWLPSNTNVSF